MARNLTIKQRAFIKEYLQNGGNGTRAALKAYNCTTENSAAVEASRLLRNPKILNEIQRGLNSSDMTLEKIVEQISSTLTEALDAVKMKGNVDHGTRLRAVRFALKILGYYS